MPRPHYSQWTAGDWTREVATQMGDQALHVLWAGGSALAPFMPLVFAAGALKWTLFALLVFCSVLSAAAIVFREIAQGESRRPWDPWLDRAFFVLGAGLGFSTGLWLLLEFC